MHRHFADWYREISLVPTPEILEKRWAGIDTFLKEIDVGTILELVCTFVHGGSCTPQFAERFTQVFVQSDSTFPMRENHNELRVLAGSCIAELFVGSDELSTLAAACTTCGSFAVSSSEPPFQDVVEDANSKLARTSFDLRSNIKYPEISTYESQLDSVLQELKKKSEAGNLPQIQLTGPIIDGLLSTEKKFVELSKQIRGFANQARQRTESLAEECDVLWWLFAGFSHDLEIAFSNVAPKALPIIVGKELADLIRCLPGPSSTRAILTRAMQSKPKRKNSALSTIIETVNALPPEWRDRVIKTRGEKPAIFPCIFPLHYGLRMASDVGAASWQNALLKKTHAKPDLSISTTQIAYQFYLESLVLLNIENKR
jgi:hypothetical protein